MDERQQKISGCRPVESTRAYCGPNSNMAAMKLTFQVSHLELAI
jgi:hypothetical protein